MRGGPDDHEGPPDDVLDRDVPEPVPRVVGVGAVVAHHEQLVLRDVERPARPRVQAVGLDRVLEIGLV